MAEKTDMKVLKNFLFHGNMVHEGETIKVPKDVVYQYELNDLAKTVETIQEETESNNLESKTVKELKELADLYGVEYHTKTKKTELIDALEGVENNYLNEGADE